MYNYKSHSVFEFSSLKLLQKSFFVMEFLKLSCINFDTEVFYLFLSFHLILRNYIMAQCRWKLFHGLIFPSCTVSINTNKWEWLTWKMAYAIILASNTKWDFSHLFYVIGSNPGLLSGGHLHHPMFITESLLVHL